MGSARERSARPSEWWVALRRKVSTRNAALLLADRWKKLVRRPRPPTVRPWPHLQAMLRGIPGALSVFFVTPWSRVIGPVRLRPHRARKLPEAIRAAPAEVRIVANPVSGGLRSPIWLNELRRTAEWLTEHGLPAELCLTDGPGGARRLAEDAVKAGMRAVVAAGGDGTINEIIQALAHTSTALGVLPLGTINLWAREMTIPLHVAEARSVLLDGVRRRVDLGRAGDRYFLLMAGIGIDAEAARRVEHHFLKRMGLKVLEYAAIGGMLGATQRPARIWVHRESRRRGRHAVQIVIGNTRLWGAAFALTQRAVADDGMLDVVLVGGRYLRDRVKVLVYALLRHPTLGPGARYERLRTIHLESDPPLLVQVDGEVIGYLPMTFAVCPRALTVIVPRTAPADLFIHPPLSD